jgi:hypothetical protein
MPTPTTAPNGHEPAGEPAPSISTPATDMQVLAELADGTGGGTEPPLDMLTAPITDEPATSTDTDSFDCLLGIVGDALNMRSPFYINAIFGSPRTWIPPFRRYSEFGIIDLWRLRRTIQYLLNITVPALARAPDPGMPPFLSDLFWQPTVILQRPDHNGSYTTYPDEHWFFINGIITDSAVAQINAAYLANLFHRPITLVQNSTDSFWLDLLECALGKAWYLTTESAEKAFPPIYDALKSEKKKVVVICHSQGTIIMAVVLRSLIAITRRAAAARMAGAEGIAPPEFIYPDEMPLNLDDFEPLEEAELAKLEIYAFANCANTMRYYRPPAKERAPIPGIDAQERAPIPGIGANERAPIPGIGANERAPIPWIESFGNQHDLVARLGMLAPRPGKWGIDIQGPRYERFGAWGHLLNEHYLFGIEDCQKVGRRRGGAGGSQPYELINVETYPDYTVPRLYSYINGGKPTD